MRVRDPRGSGRWRHARIRLGWRGLSIEGRGVLQAEFDSWLTAGGTTDRYGGKLFFRLKMGLGGVAT
jgi:hypothetical protein